MKRRIDDTNQLAAPHIVLGGQVTDPALIQRLERLEDTGEEMSILEQNDLVPQTQKKYSDQVSFRRIEMKYRADLTEIERRKLDSVFMGLGIWLLPQVLVGGGIAVARWVRAGFREK